MLDLSSSGMKQTNDQNTVMKSWRVETFVNMGNENIAGASDKSSGPWEPSLG